MIMITGPYPFYFHQLPQQVPKESELQVDGQCKHLISCSFNLLFLASQDALEVMLWVSHLVTKNRVDWWDPGEWRCFFTDVTPAIGDTYGDDVRGGDGGDGHGGWLGADMVLRIPNEDFTDVTVAIGDTYGDDVRCNDVVAGHGGWQGGATWWLNSFN